IIAVYQDPSNHSDSAWISIKVGIGGGGTPPSQQSTTMFVDADGNEVTNYTDAELVYVKVIDPSHAGATLLANAVEIDGVTYDLSAVNDQADVFMTEGLGPQLIAGEQLTATYTDPTDLTDTSTDTITIIASELDVVSFFASPSPFDGEMTFSYEGSGVASVMSVAVYDLAGNLMWTEELANVTEIAWDGTDESGTMLANGAYIYVITATDGTNDFNGKGTVFVSR
ncbi:MAG: FlgD immunoglobulin-like domain containing protein, partial [Candidatus Bipolaricaulota bacterium]